MNDLRECMVQDFVIAPFLKSILPKCDIIPGNYSSFLPNVPLKNGEFFLFL